MVQNTQEVSCVAPRRASSLRLTEKAHSSTRHPPCSAECGGRACACASRPASGRLAVTGAVRSWGCSVGFLRPSPLAGPPSPSLPRPSPVQPNSLASVRLRPVSCGASASLGSHPAPPNPARSFPHRGRRHGGLTGRRAHAHRTQRRALETLRWGVSGVGGGIRGGGIYVCLVYGVAGRGAGGGLRDSEGEVK